MIFKAKTFVTRIWRAAPVATTVLFMALAASAVFGVRAAIFWHHHPDWRTQTKDVAPWMTPRFIARAWDLPFGDFLQAINAPMPPPDGPMSLEELAAYRGIPLSQMIDEVNAFIDGSRPAPAEGDAHD